MFQIGVSLREARLRRGLSAADVHRAVRIRERYVTALEDERWELLPGDAYAKGFLRMYAEFLGLDGQLYIDEFNARFARHEEEPFVHEGLDRDGRASTILFRTLGAAAVLAAALGGYAALRHGGASRPSLAEAAAPKAVASVPAAPKRAAQKQPVKRARTPKPTFTVIRAVRDRSWLSVRIGGPGGREIFRGLLEQGHFLRYGLGRGIWLRMGRPRALDIRIGTRLVRGLPHAPADLVLTAEGPRR